MTFNHLKPFEVISVVYILLMYIMKLLNVTLPASGPPKVREWRRQVEDQDPHLFMLPSAASRRCQELLGVQEMGLNFLKTVAPASMLNILVPRRDSVSVCIGTTCLGAQEHMYLVQWKEKPARQMFLDAVTIAQHSPHQLSLVRTNPTLVLGRKIYTACSISKVLGIQGLS